MWVEDVAVSTCGQVVRILDKIEQCASLHNVQHMYVCMRINCTELLCYSGFAGPISCSILQLLALLVVYYVFMFLICQFLVFRRVLKIAKSDYLLRHVRLSAWNNSSPTGRILMTLGI